MDCPKSCPKCEGPFLDLRGAGFSPDALRAEGTCYLWGEKTYTCNHRATFFERQYRKLFPRKLPEPVVHQWRIGPDRAYCACGWKGEKRIFLVQLLQDAQDHLDRARGLL